MPDEFRRPGDFTDDEWWEPQRVLQQAATDAAREPRQEKDND